MKKGYLAALLLLVSSVTLALAVEPMSIQQFLRTRPKAAQPLGGSTRMLATQGSSIVQMSYSSVKTSITSSQVTGALGYTPLSASNPTITGIVTADQFATYNPDGSHFIECINTGAMSTVGLTTEHAGRFCYDQTLHKFRYWDGTELVDMVTGGTGTGEVTQAELDSAVLGLQTQINNLAASIVAGTGDTTAPVLTRVTPTNLTSTSSTDSLALRYTYDDPQGMHATTPLYYSIGGGAAVQMVEDNTYTVTGFAPNVATSWTVTAKNAANMTTTESGLFTYIPITAPSPDFWWPFDDNAETNVVTRDSAAGTNGTLTSGFTSAVHTATPAFALPAGNFVTASGTAPHQDHWTEQVEIRYLGSTFSTAASLFKTSGSAASLYIYSDTQLRVYANLVPLAIVTVPSLSTGEWITIRLVYEEVGGVGSFRVFTGPNEASLTQRGDAIAGTVTNSWGNSIINGWGSAPGNEIRNWKIWNSVVLP